MKTLKDIIRKNLNLISEQNYKNAYLKKDDNETVKAAKNIFWAFDGGAFGGTDIDRLMKAIYSIKTGQQFYEVNALYSQLEQYPSIADGLSKELEISGTGGFADNLGDFNKIKNYLKSIGVTVSGGWSGTKQTPIAITAPKTTTSPPSPEKKSPYKPDEGELAYRKSLDKSKPSVKPVSNPSTKEIQTLISKTEFANMIKTSKSPDGIDGIWGPKTSRALMGILNSYEQLANKAAETKKGTATT